MAERPVLINRIYNLGHSKEALKDAISREITTQLRAAVAATKFDLLRLASHCKDPFYSEESEWRLALPHTKGTPLTHIAIEHRGAGGQIPYVAHDLFSAERLPIVRVMTGPLCDQHEAVEEMLKKGGYDVPVIRSPSPLRRVDQAR